MNFNILQSQYTLCRKVAYHLIDIRLYKQLDVETIVNWQTQNVIMVSSTNHHPKYFYVTRKTTLLRLIHTIQDKNTECISIVLGCRGYTSWNRPEIANTMITATSCCSPKSTKQIQKLVQNHVQEATLHIRFSNIDERMWSPENQNIYPRRKGEFFYLNIMYMKGQQ